MQATTGDKEIDRALAHLAVKGIQRAERAANGAALTVLAKALRAAVNAADASPELKRAARQAIGRKSKKAVAKVGFGVGKSQQPAGDRQGRSGVGISAANVHWPVLGTDERQTEAGRPAGAMPAVFGGATDQALATSGTAAVEAARKKLREVIAREAKQG